MTAVREQEFSSSSGQVMLKGHTNSAFSKDDFAHQASTSSGGRDSLPEMDEEERMQGDGMTTEIQVVESEEEKLLNVLREVVRKCTLANPLKRPTAKEVVTMLEEVTPKDFLSCQFDVSDDDNEYGVDIQKKALK